MAPADFREHASAALRRRPVEHREGRERELRLGKREQPRLELEPSVPANGGTLVPRRLSFAQQDGQRERILEAEPAQFAGSHLGREEVAALDCPGEACVSRALRRHGTYVRMVCAARNRAAGASYSYIDRSAREGTRYWVQAVNVDDSRSWFGPARPASA
jgi:hypothetical protein